MKKWTKRFIGKLPKSKPGESEKNTYHNAARAKKKLKFPQQLWIEISHEAELLRNTDLSAVTAFVAGMAVGWAEHEKSVK